MIDKTPVWDGRALLATDYLLATFQIASRIFVCWRIAVSSLSASAAKQS